MLALVAGLVYGTPTVRGRKGRIMATFGVTARRVIVEAKLDSVVPAVTPEFVVNAWLTSRYQTVLSQLGFGSINKQSNAVINTTEAYSDGTVAITQGSTTVIGTDTVFAAGHEGMQIVFGNSNIWYEIADVVSPTELTLDAAVVDSDNDEIGFQIAQHRYEVDSSLRWIIDLKLMGRYSLTKLSSEKADDLFPSRMWRASLPQCWWPLGWNESNGNRIIEIFPPASIPYRLEATGYLNLTEPALGTSPHPAVSERILIEGAMTDALRYRAQQQSPITLEQTQALLALARTHENDYARLLTELSNRDSADAPQRRVRLRVGSRLRQSGIYDPIMTAEDEIFYRSPFE